MTRGEAIEIIGKGVWGSAYNSANAANWIDALIELGLLKVDEPKKKVLLSGIYYDINELAREMFVQNVGYKLVKE